MAQTQADLEGRNQDNYDGLINAIESNQGILAPLIAVCDDRSLREKIIGKYQQEMIRQEIRSYRLELNWKEPSLRATVAKQVETNPYLQRGGRAVLTVTGAEDLPWVSLNAKDTEKTQMEKFFGYLQWTREGLREFPYPIVLWVTSAILKSISRQAPDFWSWRRNVFRFASPPIDSPDKEAIPLYIKPRDTETGDLFMPLENLQVQITNLEQQDESAPNLNILYDRVAQAYRNRIQRGEVANLQQERDLAIEYFKKAIVLQTKLGLDFARMNTLTRLGNFYFLLGQFKEAISCHQDVLEIAQQVKDQQSEANALLYLGSSYLSLGQYLQSIKSYQQALVIERQIGDLQGEASALGNLGNVYDWLEQYSQAIESHQQALVRFQELGNHQGEAETLGNLGNAYQSLRQYSQAIILYRQVRRLFRQLGDRRGEAIISNNLGSAYAYLKKYEMAGKFFKKALEISKQIGTPQIEAASLNNLGNVCNAQGRKLEDIEKAEEQYSNASKFYQSSLKIAKQIGNRQVQSNSLGNLGILHYKIGNLYQSVEDYKLAINYHEERRNIAEQIGDRQGEANSLRYISLAYGKLEQLSSASPINNQQTEIILHSDWFRS